MPAYKDSKKGTWYVKFRYTDWQGNRKETTKRGFPTKREAREYEEEYKRKIQGTADMTFQSLYEIYLDDRRKNVKNSTVISIDTTARNHLLEPLGKLHLSEITPNVIRRWQNKTASKGLAQSTLKQVNRRLSAILAFAVKYYGLGSNPMKVTGTQGHYEKRVDYWTKEEFDAFCAALTNEIDKALFLTLYYTGMRIGEALALTRSDFDYARSTLTISKTKSSGEITSPKTKSGNRTINIPDKVRDAIKELLDGHEAKEIFPTSYSSLQYRHESAIKKAGIRFLPMHTLRHAHVSSLITMGVPITAISKRVGHSSPQITMSVYAHAEQDSDKKIAALLNSL